MKDSELVFGLMVSQYKSCYSFNDLRYLTAPFHISAAVLRTNLSRMVAAELSKPNALAGMHGTPSRIRDSVFNPMSPTVSKRWTGKLGIMNTGVLYFRTGSAWRKQTLYPQIADEIPVCLFESRIVDTSGTSVRSDTGGAAKYAAVRLLPINPVL